MKNSTSKVAQSINDQYYTSVADAEWCLGYLKNNVGWNLSGVALEPCVGKGSFIIASKSLKLGLTWVTNDLFPHPSVQPDTQFDIRQIQPKTKPDFVITNPPFGSTNHLAKASLKHCLTICDKVAMILPKGARRLGFLDAQPDYAHLVSDVDIPDMTFELSSGETRKVPTCFQTWEINNTKRVKVGDSLDTRTDFVTWWASGKSDFADKKGKVDFQVYRWGGKDMNKVRKELIQSGAWMSVRVMNPNISIEDAIAIVRSIDVSDYFEKSTSRAAFDCPVWLDRVNQEAVRRGVIPPKTK